MTLRATPAPDLVPAGARRRWLDSPRLLLLAGLLLVAVLAALFWLAGQSNQIAAPLLTDVLLYSLLAVDLVLLLALGFVLARSLLKLWVEQRQAAPFGRFRAKLVAALLAMSILPAVLVLISGSQIIRDSAARWFSEPVDEVLESAQRIARQYYDERQQEVTVRAQRLARSLPTAALSAGDIAAIGAAVEDVPKTLRDGMVEVYRTVLEPGRAADVAFVFSAQSTLPNDIVHATADRLAARAVASGHEETQTEDLNTGGSLLRSAVPVLDGDGVVGIVVVSQLVGPAIRTHAVRATAAYESYQGLRVLKAPIQGIYQSVFLAVSLLILMSATWLGLYLAKRITRPVHLLAEGARAIGAGQLDWRLEPETGDELGALVESFNMMAAELRTSREKIEQSRLALERKNHEVDARRRYIETILERVATGVISLDAVGRILTVNGAAERLLGLDPSSIGQLASTVFNREDLLPLKPLVDGVREQGGSAVREITLARDDREVHLAAAATALSGDDGRPEGAVIVLDDVTPLIRAQRVAAWRDVARRLAHEIKNPLTPIQLSAERIRRHLSGAPSPTGPLVAECTDAIVTEVGVLMNLVDEFAQFARLRTPRLLPADLNRLVSETLALYAAVLQQGTLRVDVRLASVLPAVRMDAEQIRQVVINLVDNAMEALGGPTAAPRPGGAPPAITLTTAHDARNGVVRLVVADNGPGVPAADRDKLFMPYYSTKGRGSGLGLAIVRRIVVEHGGGIEVSSAQPSGTAFTIELPEA
ncbi:MAG: HAMP domain-containing protein [Acidobacteria bacterium]|nr:HAMP domain-containing protein [Acidobacteriota bacterium]